MRTINAEQTLADLCYPKHLQDKINDILDDFKYRQHLLNEKLIPVQKVLLHGPPGCGKTALASALAHALDMPLRLAGSADLLSQYSNHTAINVAGTLSAVWQSETPAILLFDEFDAVAGNRSGESQGASRDRDATVNTILTELERAKPKGLIIATTNFLKGIDAAVLRRFDLVMEVPMLDKAALVKVAEKTLKGRFSIDPYAVVETCKTPALVVQECNRLLRKAVIEQAKLKETV